jgi:hypothetical protein
MKPIANVHLYRFLPFQKGKNLTTKSAFIPASLTPSPSVLTVHWELSVRIILKGKYKLTVGKPKLRK